MNAHGFSPRGQGQLIGQDEGGFVLVAQVIPPPKPSRAALEAQSRAEAAHLARMGDLFSAAEPASTSP